MSWSISCIGRPKAVIAALEKYGEELDGRSRAEYDAAKPHLIALVGQNFLSDDAPGHWVEGIIDLEASGSGNVAGGKDVQRSCKVSITPTYKELVG